MTVEGQGPEPEHTPPPASTRWTEEADEGDDAPLVPPFIPSRGGREPASPLAAPRPGAGAGTVEPEPADVPTSRDAEGEEDAFPFHAFDIEGDETAAAAETMPWEGGAVPSPPVAAEPRASEAAAAGAGDEAIELADRLEDLAARIRADGAAGVEAEMRSTDRFTALLAGMLAGYLAGRQP